MEDSRSQSVLWIHIEADADQSQKKCIILGSQEGWNRVARREWELNIGGITSFDELLTQRITFLLNN